MDPDPTGLRAASGARDTALGGRIAARIRL
jgi:hypothetical protein